MTALGGWQAQQSSCSAPAPVQGRQRVGPGPGTCGVMCQTVRVLGGGDGCWEGGLVSSKKRVLL